MVAPVADDVLAKGITSRLFEIRGQKPTRIPLNPVQAADARNALAKYLYGHLFDWLVLNINESMKPDKKIRTTTIGVLDIREELKQKARTEADTIIRDARGQIETETGKALRQIRSEIAEMSVAIASKLIQRNVSVQDNSELIEETLKQMESGSRPS